MEYELAEIGQQVICNGYPGTIKEICAWTNNKMAVVRLERGETCVDIGELSPLDV